MKVEIARSLLTPYLSDGTVGYSDMIVRHELNVIYHCYYKVGILADDGVITEKVDVPLVKVIGEDDTPEAVAFVQSSIAEITEERMRAIEAIETSPVSVVVKSTFDKPIGFCALSCNQITEDFIDDHLYSETSIALAPFVEEYLNGEKKPYIELKPALDGHYNKIGYKAFFKNCETGQVNQDMGNLMYSTSFDFLQIYKTRIERGEFS